jgi:hypothetical protein
MTTQPEEINKIMDNKLKVFFESTAIEDFKTKDIFLISN